MAESKMKRVLPKGSCCTDIHIFGESSVCPSLDDAITMSPKCRKFEVDLGWTVSGRILKCGECLEAVK